MRKLLLVLLYVFFNSYASSDPLLVVTELSPPDQILVDGKVTGKGTEFIRAIFAKANLTPDIQMYPWARAFRLASTIQNTFIYTIARTKGRENNFHWIGPVSHFELAFVALKERDDIIINNTEEAKKYKIAMQRNDFSTDILTFTSNQKLHNNKIIRLCDIVLSVDYIKKDVLRLKIIKKRM